jgi:transposase
MTILTDHADVVVGVDTHTDTHTAALLNTLGAVLADTRVPANPAGISTLLAWAGEHAGDSRIVWAVEGARSHGVGLLRALRAAGASVVEAPPPPAARRRGGKSDPLDAVAAARAALASTTAAHPRADGDREALRILLTTRRHYTDTRTATINLFKSLILTADDQLREQLRGLSTTAQLRLAIGWTTEGPHTTEHPHTTEEHLRRRTLTDLATTVHLLDQALRTNHQQLSSLVTTTMASLLDLPGVGPVTAATLLTTWSHPGRVRNEAAYAALAGVNPIPASSGRHTRYRLNRGGDRTLNRALHTIAITRRRTDPTTIAYVQRRRAEGKTDREITRCLKRYLARQLHRHMTTHHHTT